MYNMNSLLSSLQTAESRHYSRPVLLLKLKKKILRLMHGINISEGFWFFSFAVHAALDQSASQQLCFRSNISNLRSTVFGFRMLSTSFCLGCCLMFIPQEVCGWNGKPNPSDPSLSPAFLLQQQLGDHPYTRQSTAGFHWETADDWFQSC